MSFPHSKLVDVASLVTKAAACLYDGTSAATFTLGTWPSGKTGRLKITISAVTGHTDVAGTITIGSETLTFMAGSTPPITKQTTVNLTSNPVITSTGLDCHVRIVVIDTGGAEILIETLTAIDIKFRDEAEYYSQAIGGFVKRPAQCVTDETVSCINDVIRYNSIDYPIKAIHAKRDRLGIERRRVLQF